MSSNRRRPSFNKPGFTLVEVLVAASISAGLLLAMASALKASVNSFTANQISADTLQRARITMIRMSQQIRAGSDHLPYTASKKTSFISGTTVTDSGISFTDDQGQLIDYIYDSAARTLGVKVNNGTLRTMASHVSSFTVRMVPVRSAASIKTGGIYDELERATITIALNPVVDKTEITAQSLTLSDSVTPRARLWN